DRDVVIATARPLLKRVLVTTSRRDRPMSTGPSWRRLDRDRASARREGASHDNGLPERLSRPSGGVWAATWADFHRELQFSTYSPPGDRPRSAEPTLFPSLPAPVRWRSRGSVSWPYLRTRMLADVAACRRMRLKLRPPRSERPRPPRTGRRRA